MRKGADQFIEELLETVNPKQKRVLIKRYGLGGKRVTLQEIGNELRVTRERVRQIENQAIAKIRDRVKNEFRELVEKAEKFLKNTSGAHEDAAFIEEIKKLGDIDPLLKHVNHKVRFLLLASGSPGYFRENPEMKSFWYLDESAKKSVLTFIERMIHAFGETDKRKILEEKAFIERVRGLPEFHFILISKRFGTNPFGDIGLVDWPEIKPKNVRDKAYLSLKKHGKPLHFEEIARVIHAHGISLRPVNVQTVHNELIKDKRFVLVGRGVYGLEEQGYAPGTVREVITSLIEEHGPLTSSDVIRLVNEKRILKENTVLLNLQNRKHFTRLPDSRYQIRNA